MIAVATKGNRLLAGHSDGSITLWDIDKGMPTDLEGKATRRGVTAGSISHRMAAMPCPAGRICTTALLAIAEDLPEALKNLPNRTLEPPVVLKTGTPIVPGAEVWVEIDSKRVADLARGKEGG